MPKREQRIGQARAVLQAWSHSTFRHAIRCDTSNTSAQGSLTCAPTTFNDVHLSDGTRLMRLPERMPQGRRPRPLI
eukprot:8105974-Pyramimonas_sp.AAC.1